MTEQSPTSGEPEQGGPVHHDPTPTDPFGLRVPPSSTIAAGTAPDAPPAGPGGTNNPSPVPGWADREGAPAELQPPGTPQAPTAPSPAAPHSTAPAPGPDLAAPAVDPTTAAVPAATAGKAGMSRGRLVRAAAAITLVAATIGGAVGGAVGYSIGDDPGTNAGGTSLDAPRPAARQATDAAAGTAEAVAAKVLPSVVQLRVSGMGSSGEGSGVVLSDDGLILTNNHVVEAAARGGQITVVFADGTRADGEIVGRDPSSDIAVVRANGVSGLTAAELGRSDDLAVGQQVIAVGSPLGLSGTVTTGIVSALDRPVRSGGESSDQTTVLDAIQTDAAINPGNSGGPLVDTDGRVIGINSAIATVSNNGSAGSIGLGFAIPIDQVRRIADELVDNGVATQAVLGVGIGDAAAGGAQVGSVESGGAADSAGIKVGDVITKIDDRVVQDGDELVAAVRSHAPGDRITLTIGTDGRTVEATLGSRTVDVTG